MNNLNIKKYTPTVIVVLVFIVLFAIFANKPANSNNTQPIDKEKTTLSNRDLAIKEALNNTDKLQQRAQVNGVTYILTDYDDTFYGGGPKENKPGWKFGGIIVFKLGNGKPIMFWESEEAINRGSVRFFDINNDGIPEIIWDGYFGATGRDSAFYVYKFNNTGFKLITPTETIKTSSITYKQTILGGDSGFTQIEDIDNDKIQEIIVGYRDGGIIVGDRSGVIHRQIYKFNGQTYELWKEEKIKG
ncbi:MAG: VCBS repeat-containing protein [Candidatus Liptonbacteria bacterium]|nr:VCBS repeat-containing protein [Candidatus Liptonbacteria bacterium]